jgi:hypothetical protein
MFDNLLYTFCMRYNACGHYKRTLGMRLVASTGYYMPAASEQDLIYVHSRFVILVSIESA